jgi:hypothetical protein
MDLNLMGCPIDDAALKTVAGFSRLRTLDLGSTKVTDADLVPLDGLTGLKSLRIWKTQVTASGTTSLKARRGRGDRRSPATSPVRLLGLVTVAHDPTGHALAHWTGVVGFDISL